MALIRMRIRIFELEQLPPDQQQAVVEEAIRSVTASHGQMSNVAHYVGCALVAIVVLSMIMAGQSMPVTILAALPAYPGSLLVGYFLWRRSVEAEVNKVVRQLIAARGGPHASALN
jgi:Na+/glutamate symporter